MEWETGIEENVAEKVLDGEYMSIWVRLTSERSYVLTY